MPGFFDNFPQIYYTLDDPAKLQFKAAINLFVRTAMLQSILGNVNLFYNYYIKDGDTPEIIASKYYNDPTTHWIILYTNQIIDPYYQWPMDQDDFQNFLISNYGSVGASQGILDHIEKQTNVIVTQNFQQTMNTYTSIVANNVISVDGVSNLPTINNPVVQIGANNVVNIQGATIDTSQLLVAISAYDAAFQTNESHRNISIIKSDYVPSIVSQFEQLVGS